MTEEDYMPEFDQEQIVMQLGRIIDSVGNAVPRNWVKTDDGDVIEFISPHTASKMRESIYGMPPPQRLEFTRFIQNTEGFKKFLEVIK